MRTSIVWLQREGNRRDILQESGGGLLRAAKSKIRSSSCSYSVVQLPPARADSLLSSVSKSSQTVEGNFEYTLIAVFAYIKLEV